ncbi:MAG: GntR family transcriptional regulator [Aeoliella sp.]
MESKPLARSLSSQIADHLRDDVLSGVYQTDEPIRQEEVVDRYRVSRTPVREALIQLEQEGLIEMVPNCGARVAHAAPDAVQDFLIPVRSVIEVFALRMGFDKITDATFQAWEAILERMREACQANDLGALASADIAFHRSVIQLSGEPSLLRVWTSIVSQVRAYFLACYAEYDDLMSVYREHVTIVETFRDENLPEATRYLSTRIRDPLFSALSEDLLRQQFEPGDQESVKSQH